MTKIIKKILMLCLPVALLMASTSCSKDSDDSAPSSLVGTTWQADDDPQGSIVFSTTTEGTMVYASESTSFTYTYSDGSGTITMHGETGTFTVKGNKMTVTAPNGRSETFTQVSGGNGGGGGQQNDNTLVGTSWRWQGVAEGITYTIRFVFTTQNGVTVQMYSSEGESNSVNTTYAYSNGCGTIYAPPGDSGDINFTVQGNTMYTSLDDAEIFYKE